VVLVGDRERVEHELARTPAAPRDRLPIVHASQSIGMDEKPVEALRKKRDNSISRCWGLMAAGEVSAGRFGRQHRRDGGLGAAQQQDVFARGAAAGHRRDLPFASGTDRDHRRRRQHEPQGGRPYHMGSWARSTPKRSWSDLPRIGLMNVGSEDAKGTELTRTTCELFHESAWASRFGRQYRGPRHLRRACSRGDCDGFVGNVLLKAGEGAVEFLFSTLKRELARLMPDLPGDAGPKIAGSLRRLKARFEYEEFGGGPLLGIRGACIICHGSSGTRAIKNALRVAGTMAEDRLAR